MFMHAQERLATSSRLTHGIIQCALDLLLVVVCARVRVWVCLGVSVCVFVCVFGQSWLVTGACFADFCFEGFLLGCGRC